MSKTQTTTRTRVEVDVALRQARLTSEEEKVLRMRYGIPIDAAAPLESQAEAATPAVRAELMALEQRAVMANSAVDVDPLRRAAIIDRLRRM